ncbi:MAG: class I SAM-dependent methyltransferase [Bacteroidetes bacterium HGW-Bacteroidetes-16]|jgi:chemotaxis methyl-accepting protein methylase|nr:MAG: class I SAM-dependent methyltransferase [Bacteroidetes bacterium HGW-Bacteroidetes-16]
MTEENRFIDRYRTGHTPWVHSNPDFNLLETVTQRPITPCKVFEPGCGLGVESVWLAEQGFEVTAMDVSELALEKAKASAGALASKINWLSMDITRDRLPKEAFGFIFDRGFFHTFDTSGERSLVAEKLASSLEENGLWLSLMGNGDGVPVRTGPPLRSASDIVLAVDPFFEILSLEVSVFGNEEANPHKIWRCLMKKRKL